MSSSPDEVLRKAGLKPVIFLRACEVWAEQLISGSAHGELCINEETGGISGHEVLRGVS